MSFHWVRAVVLAAGVFIAAVAVTGCGDKDSGSASIDIPSSGPSSSNAK